MRALPYTLFVAALIASPAQAEGLNLGRVTWSAFTCATYAELAKKTIEQARLFDLGITSGRKFIEGVANGTISQEERAKAPWGVTMNLGGPSTDFILGRIHSFALNEAYDKVVKGANELDPTKWLDDAAAEIKALSLYTSANCELVR